MIAASDPSSDGDEPNAASPRDDVPNPIIIRNEPSLRQVRHDSTDGNGLETR